MPFGVSWTRYLTFQCTALLTMFAGAQFVHKFYRPLDDMDNFVEKMRIEKSNNNKTLADNSNSS